MDDLSLTALLQQARDDERQKADARIAALEAERDRLQSEQDQLLADSAIRSDQREKYEKLCNEMASSPRLTQQEAIDAIKALCRDNERLALAASKARRFLDISRRETVEHFERAEKLREALDGAADDLNEAGRNLAELEMTLSCDPWRSEHAHQCASEARAARAALENDQ